MTFSKFFNIRLVWLLIFIPSLDVFAGVAAGTVEDAHKKKVVVFWSSNDAKQGEAAQSLEKQIKRLSPDSEIQLKNIEDFSVSRPNLPMDEALLFFLRKNGAQTQEINSILKTARASKYDAEGIIKYLDSQTPDVVVTTHLGSLIELEKLHEKGPLLGKKLAWFFQGESEKIARDVLDSASGDSFPVITNFGAENGIGVTNSTSVLGELDFDSPSEVELILSEAIAKSDWIGEKNANPFGHIAIRIG